MDAKEIVMDHLGADAPSRKRKPKTHVHRMEIERGEKGGYVAHHELRDKEGNHHGRKGPHVIPNEEALHSHIDEHIGDQPDAAESADGSGGDADEGSGEEEGEE